MFISVTNLIIFAVLAIHFSMGHVIGGAFNTDFGDDGDSIQSSESEKAAAARNDDRTVLSRIVRRAVIKSNKSAKPPRAKAVKNANKKKGKKIEALRARRDTFPCALPTNLPQMVRELNGFLNTSQFMGKVSQVEASSPLPTGQPSRGDCPARNGSWWSRRSEVNLRSTCPWIYEEETLGSNYYPRKLLNAKCLCETCITANSMSCEEIKQNVTVFKVESCKDGLAVMTKEEVSVVVGCHCANSVTTDSRVSSG